MSKLILHFNDYASALQSNSISIQFPLVRDETVYGGYATQYRYKYYYSPIYCEITGQSNYAYCDSADWRSGAGWIEITPVVSGDLGVFDFTVPQLSYDALFKIEVQVYEDGTKSYYPTTANSTTPYFIGFYNQDTVVSFQTVERHSVDQIETIEIKGELSKTGFCKPANYGQNLESAVWGNYCTAMLQQFIDISSSSVLFQVNCQLSLANNWKDMSTAEVLTINTDNLSQWRPHEFTMTIPVKEDYAKFSSQGNVFARLEYKISVADSATEFRFYEDGASHVTSSLLLPAAISSFQVKRRSVKSQMLENDSTLGTFSTGAGMFNHSNQVGFHRNPITGAPELDSTHGHSIALYDTHATGDSPTNSPSIGFMDDEHRELAALRYDPVNAQLISNVPITWNGMQPGGGSDLPLNSIVLDVTSPDPNFTVKQLTITGNILITEKTD